MKAITRGLVWGLLIYFFCGVAEAGSPQRHGSQRESQTGQPGVFDYYVLALSWSPEFCYSHRDKPECQSGHRGFVVDAESMAALLFDFVEGDSKLSSVSVIGVLGKFDYAVLNAWIQFFAEAPENIARKPEMGYLARSH